MAASAERPEPSDVRHLMDAVARVRGHLARHLGCEEARAASTAERRTRRRAQQEQGVEAPALDELARTFSLTAFERDLLALCTGVELDPLIRAHCASAHGDPQRSYATFGLALATLPDAHWSALSPSAALRRWMLIDVASADALTTSPLRIDERVLHFLLGVPASDVRLACLSAMVQPPKELVPSHLEVTTRIAEAIAFGEPTPVIQLSGGDVASREAIAAAAVTALGMTLHRIDARDVPAAAADRDLLARLWQREALLTNAGLLVGADELSAGAALFLDTVGGILFVDRAEPLTVRSRSVVRFELSSTTAAEQRTLWRAALGDAAARLNGEVEQVAEHFQLGPAAIRAAAGAAVRRIDGGEGAHSALWEACRAEARPRLSELAQRIEPRATWDAIVLPAPTLQTLRTITAQVRQRARVYREWGFAEQGARGLGVSALFAGASGTGKTMAAEVIANELGLDLYRIDLSAVVSKYIGETEKNLRRVFDAAEQSGAILLFDEADALFGRRSEVKDSHDRYANVEISYLLQRIESYRGLAILTTNMRTAIDAAFLRRIRFVVQFPFPDVAQRAEIWRRMFPAETPTEGIDAQKLARLSLAGGGIRNVALNGAFLAADANEPVRMSHLAAAASGEYAKLERALSESEIAGWS